MRGQRERPDAHRLAFAERRSGVQHRRLLDAGRLRVGRIDAAYGHDPRRHRREAHGRAGQPLQLGKPADEFLKIFLDRRGVGRALYGALLDLLRLQGFCRAIGGITIPNPESVALHETLGFRFAGNFPKCGYKHGTWWDVGFWDLELRSHPALPEETLEA